MDDDLRSKIRGGQFHEVALHNLNNLSIQTVQFGLVRVKYILTYFYPIVENYELKKGDIVEFDPVYGSVGNKLTMSITFPQP